MVSLKNVYKKWIAKLLCSIMNAEEINLDKNEVEPCSDWECRSS
jgi:hypothetical protein